MSNQNKNVNVKITTPGCSIQIGGLIAALLSFKLNGSIMWAIIHGFLGWLYILYLCMGFGGGFPNITG